MQRERKLDRWVIYTERERKEYRQKDRLEQIYLDRKIDRLYNIDIERKKHRQINICRYIQKERQIDRLYNIDIERKIDGYNFTTN